MKKIAVIAAFVLTCSASYATEPTPKVLEAFKKTFKYVQNVSWDEHNNQYEASFEQESIKMTVVYDAEGYVVRTLRYYTEESLPILIRSRVEKKYAGKTIYGVTEYTTTETLVYTIVMQDDTHWYHVRSDAYGNMGIEKKMKK